MKSRSWPLLLIGMCAVAGVVYMSQPASKPVAQVTPRLTPEEIAQRQRLHELDGARRPARIQTGTGDAHFIAGEPLLIFPPTKIHRPKPNEGDTGSHWYTGEAATAEQRK